MLSWGAVLAAIPTAVVIEIGVKVRRISLALAVGLLVASAVAIGDFNQYGIATSAIGWITDILQFLAIYGAVIGVVALIEICPPSSRGKRITSNALN